MIEVKSPLQATVIEFRVRPGDFIHQDDVLVVLDSMKMEHLVSAPSDGRVTGLGPEPGEVVSVGETLVRIDDLQRPDIKLHRTAAEDTDVERMDLAEMRSRLEAVTDGFRPEAVAKRHDKGARTARENVDDLCDDDSFVEYGALAIAAQAGRRDRVDLIARTSGDGIITGVGSVNALLFGPDESRVAVMA